MIQNESIVKVPQGKCPHCGEEYGILVLVETGEQVNEYTDCMCFDSVINQELFDEEHAKSLGFIL